LQLEIPGTDTCEQAAVAYFCVGSSAATARERDRGIEKNISLAPNAETSPEECAANRGFNVCTLPDSSCFAGSINQY